MNSITSFPNVYALLVLFASLANLILGGMVVFDSPLRKINRLFSLLCFALALWGISFIGLNLSKNHGVALLWSHLHLASLLFTPPLFFHLVLDSFGPSFRRYDFPFPSHLRRIMQLAYAFSAGWLVLTVGGVLPHQITHGWIFAFPRIGRQFWVAAFVYGSLTGTAIWLMVRNALLNRDSARKSRLLVPMIGAVVIGSFFCFFLIHPIARDPSWRVPLGHWGSTLFLIFIAYALSSSHLYHFLELFRKTVSFLVMTVLLLAVFGGTHFLASKILAPSLPGSAYFALGMASIMMALFFHPLRYWVQNMVDRVLFTQRYRQMQRLRGLSRRVYSSADREELLTILFGSLKGIGFGAVTLLLKDPQKPIFHIKKSTGLSEQSEGFFLRNDSLLIQYLRSSKGEIIRDEMTHRIMTDRERQSLSEEMEILEAEISFPLFSTRQRALFGVVTLGKSELGYSSYIGRNIFWLKNVIDNASIMLDNFYHQEFANALIPYVGRTWADEMRRNKEGFRERLAGSRRWVSILMVDIRHFTSMSSRMDAHEVVNLLEEFRSRVAPIVYRHQGTIDKFIGDAIMIVFGLPILPHLDNPDKNAAQCAQAIIGDLVHLNAHRFSNGHKERISIGIGLASGEVIAGNVDSGDRVEYTVIGDAANMVARLEDLAGDNQILLSEATYRRVKESVDVHPWEPRRITGFNDLISIYELNKIDEISFSPSDENAESPPDINRLAANQ